MTTSDAIPSAEEKSPWVFQIISCPSTVPAARLQPQKGQRCDGIKFSPFGFHLKSSDSGNVKHTRNRSIHFGTKYERYRVLNIRGRGIETMLGCPTQKTCYYTALRGMLCSLTQSEPWVALKNKLLQTGLKKHGSRRKDPIVAHHFPSFSQGLNLPISAR